MDAPCEIQGSIHVFRLVNNMCPGKWVHIISGEAIFILAGKQTTLKTIMARVEHNEPKTTLSIYTHVTDAMKEQEKQILDSIDIMA